MPYAPPGVKRNNDDSLFSSQNNKVYSHLGRITIVFFFSVDKIIHNSLLG